MSFILAFAGSNPPSSINSKLMGYTSSLIQGHEIEMVDKAHKDALKKFLQES